MRECTTLPDLGQYVEQATLSPVTLVGVDEAALPKMLVLKIRRIGQVPCIFS